MSKIAGIDKSSKTSTSTGVFARLVDDWLTSTPERGFEAPFCQLLISEGYDIVHVDSHSPMEEGKDILAFAPDRKLCGFQLKAGDVSTSRWRDELQVELRELVELPCHHPRVAGRRCDRGYCVVTGMFTEPALHRLAMFNDELPKRFARVELVHRLGLLARILESQAAVFPVEPVNVKALLEIMFRDGDENLDRRQFAAFLKDQDLGRRGSEIGRRLAAASLLGAYAMSSVVRADNHLAVAEAWSLIGCDAIQRACQHQVSTKSWRPVVDVSCSAAMQALERLAEEAITDGRFLGRSPLGDGGPIWRSRVTLVLGAVAAWRLAIQCSSGRDDADARYTQFVRSHLDNCIVWGESAFAPILLICLYLAQDASSEFLAEDFLGYQYLSAVCAMNGRREGLGVPSPYHDASECLEVLNGMRPDAFAHETFRGSSFTGHPCVLLLARRMRRHLLSAIWPLIGGLAYSEVALESLAEHVTFHSRESGEFSSRFYDAPCRWAWLQEQCDSEMGKGGVFSDPRFTGRPEFPILFALTHPHRLTASFCLWLEGWLRQHR